MSNESISITVNGSTVRENCDCSTQTDNDEESLVIQQNISLLNNSNQISVVSSVDHTDNNTSSVSLSNSTIDDDIAILNDPQVQNEEELIIFKEKFNDMTNENLKLKQDIINLKNSYEHLRNKSILNLMLYLSPIIVLIAYLIISYL